MPYFTVLNSLFWKLSAETSDDSLVSDFSSAIPWNDVAVVLFGFFHTKIRRSFTRAVATTRASYWHLLYDIGSIAFSPGRYTSREIIYACARYA